MMKQKIVATLLLAGGIAIALLGRPEAASTRRAAGCTLKDLDGTFAFSLHGVNPLGQPFGAVGTLTADGAGNLSGTRVQADNGVRTEATFTCQYTMNAECLFNTADTCVDAGETQSEARFDGVVSDNGREAHLLLNGVPSGGAGVAVVTGIARQ